MGGISLLDLPGSDVLLKIIDYLSPSDWLNLRYCNVQTYNLVNEYFKYMKCLDLSHHQHFPKSLCQILGKTCHSLKVIKIRNSQLFSNDVIKNLIQNNHNLHHLDLTNSSDLKNGTLQPLVNNCRKLEEIILKNCHWVTVGAVEILAFHFPGKIKVADFSGCNGLSEASVILFIKRQPNLESLSLGNLSNIGDDTIFFISKICTRLKYLDLARCVRITDSEIQMLDHHCPNLRSLKVDGCPEVSERSLSKLRLRQIWIDKLQYPPYLLQLQNKMVKGTRTQF